MNNIIEDIDKIDLEIVNLISKRAKKIHELAKIRENEEDIYKNDRFESIKNKVRAEAIKNNLSPNMMEDVFKIIFTEMIVLEITEYKNKKFF